MANEIRTTYTTGSTIDGYVKRPSDGYVWYPAGETFEEWGTNNRTAADYAAITMTESASGSCYYIGSFPTDITTEAKYDVQLRLRSGANPADSDTPIGLEQVDWTGAEEVEEEVVEVTWTDFSNYALSKIGGGGEDVGSFRIANLYETTDTAALCRVLIPQIRKEVLCRAWWNEATKYADLGAELSGVKKAGWEYAFNLPQDYIGRCKQINEDYHKSTKPRYIAEYDKEINQGRLFTNNYTNSDGDSAYIKYIFKLTDISKFSPLLYEAMAVKMGAELAGALLADNGERRQVLLREYEGLVLPVAEGANQEEIGDDEDLGEYSSITCRTT